MPTDDSLPEGQTTVPALRVQQWLEEWDEVPFDEQAHRAKPEPFFYTFSLPATMLKRLTGVHKRTAEPGVRRSEELSTQRLHEKDRSNEIAEFVRYGFPWSRLSARQRQEQHPDLRKPGWLPTAILINVLRPGEERDGRVLAAEDAVRVDIDPDTPLASVRLPGADPNWEPSEGGLHPLEVIDGQHRLWAFEDGDVPDTYHLPVTAFVGLDRSWQAYLFWSINITPKKINASLAYDLYPLLRGEEWLERFAGPFVYRESRAQELVEALWAHPMSPWHHRINMLGERGQGQVRQAAYVRTLTNTLVRPAEGSRVRIGGLFGARPGEHELVVPWSRPQQAAFLIRAWRELFEAIEEASPHWAQVLTAEELLESAPFVRHSLLNTDQGVRAFLGTLNDVTVLRRAALETRLLASRPSAGVSRLRGRVVRPRDPRRAQTAFRAPRGPRAESCNVRLADVAGARHRGRGAHPTPDIPRQQWVQPAAEVPARTHHRKGRTAA